MNRRSRIAAGHTDKTRQVDAESLQGRCRCSDSDSRAAAAHITRPDGVGIAVIGIAVQRYRIASHGGRCSHLVSACGQDSDSVTRIDVGIVDLVDGHTATHIQADNGMVILISRAGDGQVTRDVGSINVHANVDLMIKAFSEANIPNSEFRIYGGGNQKEACQQLVKDMGLSNVTFGFVSRNEIPAVQAAASVLVLALPTGNGNLCLPSKLTSYLLSGRPVLASVDQDSSTKRILEGEGCGKTVVPDDKEAFITGFKFFADKTHEQMTKMGERSREYAMAHLTREVNLSLVINTIKQIVNNG